MEVHFTSTKVTKVNTSIMTNSFTQQLPWLWHTEEVLIITPLSLWLHKIVLSKTDSKKKRNYQCTLLSTALFIYLFFRRPKELKMPGKSRKINACRRLIINCTPPGEQVRLGS